MKHKLIIASLIVCSYTLLSCEYFGKFHFTIKNNTNKTITVKHLLDGRSYNDILPTSDTPVTVDYGEAGDTVITIRPLAEYRFTIDIGMVDKNFPTQYDTPESWNVTPLWDAIIYMVMGNDTIPRERYSKDKWQRTGADYVLEVEKQD